MDRKLRYRQKHVHDIPIDGSFVRLWDVEGTANSKVVTKAFQHVLRTGFVYPYVALMPDYHPGEGSMVGSVIPTKEVLLPSVIGGDLGCGMIAIQLPIDGAAMLSTLWNIQKELRNRIPTGTAHNTEVTERVEKNAIWERGLRAPILTNRVRRKLLRQFASLGGGNHFIEMQCDQENQVWIMLHSGSRYLGVIIRDYYVEKGQSEEDIEPKRYSKVPYLRARTEIANDYLHDLRFAMDFARESRKEMMIRCLGVFCKYSAEIKRVGGQDLISNAYDIAHNYVAEEEHFGENLFVHRKGAIRVREDEVGLIPGSMGTCSYVVKGRGNEYGFCSCSHGAGRAMSRTEAFRRISERDFRKSMEGVIYQHSDRIKDEAPLAYKDIQRVMRGQKDLVRIISELRPLMSIKGL